jgi:hypothetical protein
MFLLFIPPAKIWRLSILPKRAVGMLGGNLDGLVEVVTFEKIEAADPFPRLEKRTVGDQYLPLASPTDDGVLHTPETVAEDSHLPSVPFIDPIAYVLLLEGVYLSPSGSTHTNIR